MPAPTESSGFSSQQQLELKLLKERETSQMVSSEQNVQE